MPGAPAGHNPDLSWLDGGGETGALIRAFDWATTDLGPLEGWPQSLRTTTGLLLLSPVPIVLLWGEKGYMIYNDAYSVFAGGRHPQLLGSEVRKGWDEIADFNDNVMRVGLAGGTLAYKDQQLTLIRRGLPEPVWMNLDYSPVVDESGSPGGVIAIVVETTERVRAEQSIRGNEARLRFLDTLRESTAKYTDADQLLATTTRMLARHLGVSICAYADMDEDENGFTIRGDWCAPGSPSIVGRYKLADFGRLAVTSLSAGKPYIVRDNRAELPPEESEAFQQLGASATICMPLIRGGRLTALMAVHDREARDWQPDDLALLSEVVERSWSHIERVRAEAAVRESDRRFREALEAKVHERTAALMQAEEALMQAQKMEALGNLTGGIAHDFNNLLMVIQGSLELLRERLPEEPQLLRLVDTARSGAERGAVLTRRMLAFARRQDLKAERIDLRVLVEGMTELMQRSLGPTIVIETRFGPEPATIEGDANQIESALLNLAVNARDAMDGVGTMAIHIDGVDVNHAHGPLVAGRYVRLSLSDTGAGMDDATLKRATEPFFTTKGVGKGTGLGLSMVHGLAEQLGGSLFLTSRPDVGTTAEIWLPATDADAGDDPAPVTDTPVLVPANPMREDSPCILAVDDDDLVRATTAEMLQELGYRVVTARSGAEALSLLERTPVDLVLTDHAMPQMTGAQLAQRVRELAPSLPVVMVTGYADLAGGAHVDIPRLAKPFSQGALTEILARALKRAQA
ncbi:response regulator [Luteibacter sp.]|uniref:GAF domain-containing hybrid sensor histidine kinase/response regulator n=1 Tax=Luteibacter sp. TaxID=1886636 RepID=UPI0028089417|nr:response regulator [Luteibacter sp.]MDQ8048531.1 response regulator [Luteibacter sp.]